MKYNKASFMKVKRDIMARKRKRKYERIIYPHIRYIGGLEGFEAPKRCEVDVGEEHLIVRQEGKEKVLYYDKITNMHCGSDNTLSSRFYSRDTGTWDPKFDVLPEASKTAIRGAEMLYSVQIWYKEETDKGGAYDIVFIDDIESNPKKECMMMGIQIEHQFLRGKHKDESNSLRDKYDF